MVDILQNTLENTFKLSEFRGPQRLVCSSILKGHDTLLIMPTGGGKSLCYQLPGVILGTTLVISPLIALMDDQYNGINKLGLKAERIHSGMKDSDVASVIYSFTKGEYNFLFISPERLGTDFSDTLRNYPPALIAIDEIDCLSTWGRDFRPDYRLIKDRLPPGIPVIGLTATATPKVQLDIIDQLGRPNIQLIVHGFRRANIAITVQDCTGKEREAKIVAYLKSSGVKPAIVYCGTRKQTESVAALLKKQGHKCEGYHAGMTPKARQDVQERFMSGELEVISATLAFGLGINKSNIRTVLHLSMPGSIEAYYQEIGRAGRDQQPSKAVLFTNYEDKARQLWFLDKSYPSVEYLQLVYDKLTDSPQSIDNIKAKIPTLDAATLTTVLGKLVTYGSAIKSFQQYVKGEKPFRAAYLEARKYALDKLEAMFTFTKSKDCRMLGFLNYFGDTNDDYAPCNMCDNCLKKSNKTPEALKKSKVVVPLIAQEGFSIGSYVEHVKYGKGKVEASEKGSMGNRQATVRFADGTRRVIIERYLKQVS
jgi:RecQ family ATP-dependent DNA helicase